VYRNGFASSSALQINVLRATRRHEDRNHCTGTQRYTSSDDNIRMNANTGSDTREFDGALWIGALMAASAMIKDPFPPELEEVAVKYFELLPPTTKA
jgi:hypothetical protein